MPPARTASGMFIWKLTPFLFAAVALLQPMRAQTPSAASPDSPPHALKRVAFVFDDGPTTEQLTAFLDLFAREKIHVNFSFVGKAVDAHPELARSAVERGHEINNHSYTHPHLPKLADAEILEEIQKTSAAIEKATGRPPAWFWAPFLEIDEKVRVQLAKVKLTAYPYETYNFISSEDWNAAQTTAEMIRQKATTGVVDGTVILFHEWRAETLQQMPAIIAELRRQGCTFMTFTELAGALPHGRVKAP